MEIKIWGELLLSLKRTRSFGKKQYSSFFHEGSHEWKMVKTIISQNYVYVLRTTTTRLMVSFIDFYFHFLANFASYVLYIYLYYVMCHTQWAWVTYDRTRRSLEQPGYFWRYCTKSGRLIPKGKRGKEIKQQWREIKTSTTYLPDISVWNTNLLTSSNRQTS